LERSFPSKLVLFFPPLVVCAWALKVAGNQQPWRLWLRRQCRH
jgi:hypothetical protein